MDRAFVLYWTKPALIFNIMFGSLRMARYPLGYSLWILSTTETEPEIDQGAGCAPKWFLKFKIFYIFKYTILTIIREY